MNTIPGSTYILFWEKIDELMLNITLMNTYGRLSMNRANEMTKLIYKAMEDKKAEDIRIIDIGEVSTIADYFIICSGANSSQMEAIIDNITESLGRAGFESKRTEGGRNSSWILMDYGDVVVHIFSKEDRLFYDLERIWRDGKSVDISTL